MCTSRDPSAQLDTRVLFSLNSVTVAIIELDLFINTGNEVCKPLQLVINMKEC